MKNKFEEDLRRSYEILADQYDWYERDNITGGLSRSGFLHQVKEFLDGEVDRTEYEILFFNILNFKAINELFGIKNGDKVLRLFYQKLLDAAFQPLVVARIETDHFACFAKRQGDTYEYMDALCNQNIEQNGKLFQIHVHCGIFHIMDTDMSVSAMLDRARLAKINSEQEHKRCYDIYTKEMKNEYVTQAELAAEFAQALQNDEFQVYYQPIVHVDTGMVASAEALVRWIHPEKGVISPGVFIPALEQKGNISRLDGYMVEQVYCFQKKRQQSGHTLIPISVNLSGIDLYDCQIRDRITNIFESCEIEKQMLCFEITETSYIAMDQASLELIHHMRAHGIKLLVDDFGKGYSSLNLLNKGDFDVLKIDMEFVQQMEDDPKKQIILHSIIDMAQKLGLETIAEGVETKRQWDFLRECGCTYAQGYYFARPMPEAEFIGFLEANPSPFHHPRNK